MLLAGSEQAHHSLALYLAVRGLTLLVRCGNLPEAHPLKARCWRRPHAGRRGDVRCVAGSAGEA